MIVKVQLPFFVHFMKYANQIEYINELFSKAYFVISGWLYDVLMSYQVPFLLAGGCMTLSSLLLTFLCFKTSLQSKHTQIYMISSTSL